MLKGRLRLTGHLEISSGEVRPGYTTVFCLSILLLTRRYSPTFPAAFSRNSEPSRMYLRRVASDRWPGDYEKVWGGSRWVPRGAKMTFASDRQMEVAYEMDFEAHLGV